jgi:hypothetical protein
MCIKLFILRAGKVQQLAGGGFFHRGMITVENGNAEARTRNGQMSWQVLESIFGFTIT